MQLNLKMKNKRWKEALLPSAHYKYNLLTSLFLDFGDF